jgi:porphyrinogen peroxidase
VGHPQPGIFALGTASHAYLEFDATDAHARGELVRQIASLREENPTLVEAPELSVIGGGHAGAGGSILHLQKWAHDANAWEALSGAEQEQVIGRTKLDSIELEDGPDDSHVASTDQERFGKIFRRNMPYGTVTDHGTMFVGFCAEQRPLAAMLESMAGANGGPRDALTRFTSALTGAYYFVPSIEALRAAAGADTR